MDVLTVEPDERATRSAFGRYGRFQFFVGRRDGRAVAKLAAIVNPRLVDAAGAPIGQIGWFEHTDGDGGEDLGALFEAAFAWLRSAGATQAIGPMNGGAHLQHRFMTRGFDRAPFLLEPRNPAHHPRLFAMQGFSPIRRWNSYDVSRADLDRLIETLHPAAERARRRFRVEHGAPGDAARTLARLHPLLDVVWAGHAGYAHLELDELDEVFRPLLGIMTERHLAFLVDERTGRDAGLAFTFPDLAGGADRSGVVLHTVAVAPDVRTTGAVHLLMKRMIETACAHGHTHGVVALVDQDFRFFDRVVPPTREHALFGRLLV